MSGKIEPVSILYYIETVRLNEKGYKAIRENRALVKEGLKNEEFLRSCLSKGRYLPVLDRIWAESNLKTRIQWLRSHRQDLDVILLIEQVRAELELLIFEHHPEFQGLDLEVSSIDEIEELVHLVSVRSMQDISSVRLKTDECEAEMRARLQQFQGTTEELKGEITALRAKMEEHDKKPFTTKNMAASTKILAKMQKELNEKLVLLHKNISKIKEFSKKLEEIVSSSFLNFEHFLRTKTFECMCPVPVKNEDSKESDLSGEDYERFHKIFYEVTKTVVHTSVGQPYWILNEVLHPQNPFYGTKIKLVIDSTAKESQGQAVADLLEKEDTRRMVASMSVD